MRSAKNSQYVLRIEQDEDPGNPREEFDNVGNMVCWHNRYRLGDKHDFKEPREFLEILSGLDEAELKTGAELMDAIRKNHIILPLYLYDHSIQRISTESFIGRAQHAEWDSMQVGWIYASLHKVRHEWGVGPQANAQAVKYLTGEVKTYDQYLSGDVYGYTVTGRDGEVLDSCWGFWGYDPKENGMSENMDPKVLPLLDQLEDGDCGDIELDMVNNEEELLDYLEAENREMAKKYVYKFTECGAWIDFAENGIRLGSIVEGSDAEIGPYVLQYPFSTDEYDETILTIETEADAAWREANEEEVPCL